MQMRKNSWLSTQRKVLFAFPLCFMTVIAKIRPCSFHSFDPLVLRSLLWRSLFTGLFSARNRDIAQLSVPENPAYLWVGSFFNPFSDMSLAGSKWSFLLVHPIKAPKSSPKKSCEMGEFSTQWTLNNATGGVFNFLNYWLHRISHMFLACMYSIGRRFVPDSPSRGSWSENHGPVIQPIQVQWSANNLKLFSGEQNFMWN